MSLMIKALEEIEAKNLLNMVYSDTVTASASAVTTVTLTFSDEVKKWIKKLYADRVANCSYEWNAGGIVIKQNEFEFPLPQKMRHNKIILKITNSGTTDEEIDYFIAGIAKMVV